MELYSNPIKVTGHTFNVSECALKVSDATINGSEAPIYRTLAGPYGTRPQFFNAIDSFANSHLYNSSLPNGQYLETLYSVQAELLAQKKAAEEAFHQHLKWLRARSVTLDATQVVPSIEELLALFSNQIDYPYTPPIGILNFLFANEHFRYLLRGVKACIAAVRKAFAQTVPRFCALSWTRRQFYLMHGIRPPRAGQWEIHRLALECAR
jgi:hypothetical protein